MKKITSHTDLEGWFDYHDIYDEAVNRFGDGSVFVEIGTYLGCSAAYLGKAIKDSGKKIEFFTIDTFEPDSYLPYKPEDSYEQVKKALHDLDLKDFVTPVKGRSLDVAGQFDTIDFLFIDGAHDYETVRAELETYLPKMNPGGVIAGHDYADPGVNRAVHEVFTDIEVLRSSWRVILK